jgi:1-acyl-sn-glycerol-3-phosphate acyltransferase
MRDVGIDRPYVFTAPRHGRYWHWVLAPLLRQYLRHSWDVVDVAIRGVERLREATAGGCAVILASNHCRDSDPFLLGPLAAAARTPFYIVAGSHVFALGGRYRFFARCGGAFSVDRDGIDRHSLAFAVHLLEQARRPLVIFPEGDVSLTNDRLSPLLGGVAVIGHQAARRRRQAGRGPVVVLPMAIRYHYAGRNLMADLDRLLGRLEERLTWRPQSDLPPARRLARLHEAILTLKEVEHLGIPQQGAIAHRLGHLIDRVLTPLEQEWSIASGAESTTPRIRRLRMAMASTGAGSATQRERWQVQVKVVELAQALARWWPEGLVGTPGPERLLEAAQRCERDLTGGMTNVPLRASVTLGEALEVSPNRDDALLERLATSLSRLLGIQVPAAELVGESRTRARGEPACAHSV